MNGAAGRDPHCASCSQCYCFTAAAPRHSTHFNMSDSTPSTSSGSTLLTDEYKAARVYLEKLFDTSNSQASCVSVLPHDLKNVHDLQAHFFGCLDIKKREAVLDDADHEVWKQATKLELEDTGLYSHCTKTPNPSQNNGPPDMRYITALNLQAELKRIQVLRRTPALKGLVREIGDSIGAWRNEHDPEIKTVRDLRQNSHAWHENVPAIATTRSTGISMNHAKARTGLSNASRPTASRRPTTTVEASRDELDEDLGRFLEKLNEIIEKQRSKDNNPEPEEGESPYELKRDIKARLIKLARPDSTGSDANSFMANVMEPLNEKLDDKVYKGSFPDQRLSVYHLLERGKFKQRIKREVAERKIVAAREDETTDKAQYDIALTDMLRAERACPSELRYFHIPANNMSVRSPQSRFLTLHVGPGSLLLC